MKRSSFRDLTGGAFGAGLVLVVAPAIAVVASVEWFDKRPIVGLPILAIFGITMLFGALSLVASLFKRLDLTDRCEALALPAGSVRAVLALALVVMFALISVMLYESMSNASGEFDTVAGLSKEERETLVKNQGTRVAKIVEQSCPATPVAGAAPCTPTYSVDLRRPVSQESADFAKQLMTLIGTLLTSLTSFYFGSRSSEAASKSAIRETKKPPADPTKATPSPTDSPKPDAEADVDGCNVKPGPPTPDDALPAARGGVQS